MIVIYTGEVRSAEAEFRIECMTLRMEQVFVRDLSAEEIYQQRKRRSNKEEDSYDEGRKNLV